MNDVSGRLRAVRQHLRMSQQELSTKLGLGINSWQRYELEGKLPKADVLEQLVRLGFDAHWLLTGEGTMLGSKNAAQVDAQLMGRVVDAIKALYKAQGVGIADIQVGQVAAGWYNQIVAEAPDDPIGQGLALAGRIEEHRAQLRRDAADPAHAKRQA
ncbi:helix-turn-helix domain-containing protein [Caenispirillum bisanense]|uniref:Helix-turn-helix domain-containing protein n=1 Tax=Caenispirillum bisanense TaxID=414052 RepID=A0A286GYK1_9PROT|nr:helix-turn-helix transcriptional regulator [Caenispirillum bisanense]SOE00598.1 Helix-turn-helix domain-containing protein [Caenispirillum bisanense]